MQMALPVTLSTIQTTASQRHSCTTPIDWSLSICGYTGSQEESGSPWRKTPTWPKSGGLKKPSRQAASQTTATGAAAGPGPLVLPHRGSSWRRTSDYGEGHSRRVDEQPPERRTRKCKHIYKVSQQEFLCILSPSPPAFLPLSRRALRCATTARSVAGGRRALYIRKSPVKLLHSRIGSDQRWSVDLPPERPARGRESAQRTRGPEHTRV